MKLSTRTRYGMRAMLELALNYGKGPVQLKYIAHEEEISVKYLEQLMTVLKGAGLVTSVRGFKGGHILARPPVEIKLIECFDCLEGPVMTINCVVNKNACHRSADCVCRELWSEFEQAAKAVLERTTLQDLVDRKRQSKIPQYNI